jgi:hypothetical protein
MILREWSLAEQHRRELLKGAADLRLARDAAAGATPICRPSVRDRLSAFAVTLFRAFGAASASTPPEWPGRYRGYR